MYFRKKSLLNHLRIILSGRNYPLVLLQLLGLFTSVCLENLETYTKKRQFPTIFGCFFIFYIVVVFVTPMHFLWFHRCQRRRSRHPHHVMSGGLKSNQNDELQQIPLQISKLSMSVCLTACPSFPSLSVNTLKKIKINITSLKS